GQILASALVIPSSSAAVTTNRVDYHPGQPVTVTGTGWIPGEPVSLLFHEQPEGHPDVVVLASADASGSFTNSNFAPAPSDAKRTFTLTATGQLSGFIAQTGLNDSGPIAFVQTIGTNTKNIVTNNSITVTVPVAGVAAGDSIIVTLRVGSFAGAIGCSDSQSNTYNTDITSPLSGAARSAVVSPHNVTPPVTAD